jgi:ribosomal protein S8
MRQYLNNPIASCVSSINLGYAAKQLFVELPVTKQLHSLLTVFVALGVIQSFSIKKPASRPRPAVVHKHPRLQMFFAARTAVSNGVPRNSGGYAFVVYLKYVDYTPVFSGVRNYWLSRRKVIIPYSSLQVSRVQNTKQVFVL